MKILIAIDEKRFVPVMLDYIFKHHFPTDSSFRVLNVVEPHMVGSYMSVLPPPLLDEISQEAWNYGKKLVRTVALKLRDHYHIVDIEEAVVPGFASAEIIQAAEDFKADLIVLGSHGKHSWERFMLGSVSSKVAAGAPCSVLIVRSEVARAESACRSELSAVSESQGENKK